MFRDYKILALSRHTEDGYLKEILRAGASGYVLKQSAPLELFRAETFDANDNLIGTGCATSVGTRIK
jgi:CheY-like chemotaxis protein